MYVNRDNTVLPAASGMSMRCCSVLEEERNSEFPPQKAVSSLDPPAVLWPQPDYNLLVVSNVPFPQVCRAQRKEDPDSALSWWQLSFQKISWEQHVQLLSKKITNSYWHHQPSVTWFAKWHKGWQIHINSSQQMDYKYSPSQLPPDRTVLESSNCGWELSTLNLPISMYCIKHTTLWSWVDTCAVAQHGLDQKLLVPSTRRTSHYPLSQDFGGRKERGMSLTGCVGVLVMQLPQHPRQA